MKSLSSIGKSEMMQAGASVAQSQRFNGYPSSRLAEIAARVVNEFDDDEYDDVLYSNTDTNVQESREKPLEGSHEEDEIGERTHVVDGEESGGDEEDDSDFEFSVLCGDEESLPISADEIFYNGQIRPMFPIFNSDLVFGNAEWNPDRQKDFVEAQKISNPEMISPPAEEAVD
ncbi:hypothetical protein Nepgr_023324 [Nepenthes gracilis]|uniref:Uncharacterized protein n=1 Tax=Nepenthes gracilis TaxID=150966 RepID=A0AAD3T3L2_NEPGR|nr:hypothetical protein Nepgr_023324 [Nepenthes gracilis]